MSRRRRELVLSDPQLAKLELDELAEFLVRQPEGTRDARARHAARVLDSPFTGWPHCAICDKLVERIETDRDVMRQTLIVIAYCHGAHEEVELDWPLLESAISIDIGGKVFDRPQLPTQAGTE